MRGHHLIRVRGTPGSGKSMLMHLLHAYICERDKTAIVRVIETCPPRGTWESLLSPNLEFDGCTTIFLWDNAQETYSESDLWEFLFSKLGSNRD
jgi:hypothetical protein